ncbi:MAG: ParB/RepB/Spo0J family partition protein [Oscillospiraceae bacterium]|nr:ParB/RepB/Spo0J family partition protein [Oscillospiraceae bacterium]
MAPKRGGLGMGLEALFSDNSSEVQVKKTLRTSEIEPNRLQPRKTFDEDAIASLAESIKEHGMIQPLIVRPYMGSYQIVAGERRWRAARSAEVEEVPVIIKELSDAEAMQFAIIENLQREDLNPVEEAAGFKELSETYGMTQEDIAKIAGISRSAVSNSIRILGLPEEVQELIKEGLVSVGHAKVLLSVEDEELVKELALRVSEGCVTVRTLEKIVAGLKADEKKSSEKKPSDSYFKEMEISLRESLGRKVTVKNKGNDKGTLVVEFYDKADLLFLADKLAK